MLRLSHPVATCAILGEFDKPCLSRHYCSMKLHLTQPDAHNATARLLTTTDVAEILQVSQSTVLNWCRDGRILAIRLPSGQYRVPRRSLIGS